ncbi:hypothetical protein DPEC_G00368230 [Dallia pectoralis]|nr:hypothetical protein DPEC_G00368230 [Dallia pectoralis]
MSSTTPGPLAPTLTSLSARPQGLARQTGQPLCPPGRQPPKRPSTPAPENTPSLDRPEPKRVRLVERYEDFATAEMAERVLEHRPGRVHAKELLTELQLAFFHMAMVKFQIKDTVDLENKAWAIIRYGQRSGVWPDDPWVPNRCRTPFVAYVMEKIKTNLRRRAKTALLEESRRSLLEMTGGGPSQ